MVDFTKPVQTSDGRPVEIITTKGRAPYPVIGYVDDNSMPISWTIRGRQYSDESPSANDLINVPEKREYWVDFVNFRVRDYYFNDATHKITIFGDDCRIEKL